MRHILTRVAGLASALMLVFASGGCAREEPGASRLTVFAASSLTDVFEDLKNSFEEGHPDVDVELAFAGSQILRFQIEQGASADLFASANEAHMQGLVDAGLVQRPRTLGVTELVVIVPTENPAGIERFDELDRASSIVVGTEYVPIGMYTETVLQQAAEMGPGFASRVRDRIVSMESNVRLVRAKVELGEADAAFVYHTDAHGSDRVLVIPIPAALNIEARFPIAVTSRATNTAEARRFLAYLASPAAREVLTIHGFEPALR